MSVTNEGNAESIFQKVNFTAPFFRFIFAPASLVRATYRVTLGTQR